MGASVVVQSQEMKTLVVLAAFLASARAVSLPSARQALPVCGPKTKNPDGTAVTPPNCIPPSAPACGPGVKYPDGTAMVPPDCIPPEMMSQSRQALPVCGPKTKNPDGTAVTP